MVEKYKQDNNLTVLLEPVEGMVSVSVGLWIKTGSRNELVNQYGYAHFVEHMLFKGTENNSAADLARLVDRVGGQHNAATNREYTCYYINVVSDHLELAVEILADMFYNSLIDPVELEKEKNVIIEEIRMYEDTPDEFIHDLFMEKMLEEHPLSHSILGTEKGIAGTARDDLMSFYKDHYTEDNAILVIAGKLDTDKTRGLISKYFNRTPAMGGIQEINSGNPVRTEFLHIERNLEQVHFCLGTEGIKKDDPDRWALYALSTIFGGSMSSRLFQNIREKEGICYSIYSFHSSYSDQGIFGIYCATSPSKFAGAVELIIEECRKVLDHGVSDEELADACAYMKGNLALGFESNEVRMGQLAKNELTYGRYYSFDDIVKKINSITQDDFRRITERIFSNTKLSLVSVGDIKEKKLRGINFNV